MWVVLMLDWTAFQTEPHSKQKDYIHDCIDRNIQYVAAFCGIQAGKSFVEADGAYASAYGPDPIMLDEDVRGKAPMEMWIVSKSYPLAEAMLDTFRLRTPEGIWASERECRNWGVTKGDRYTHWLKPRENCPDRAPIKLRVRTASDPESLRATNKLGLVMADELAHWKPMAWTNLQGRAVVARTKYLIGSSPKGKNFTYRTIALPGGYQIGVSGRHRILDPKIRIHTWTSADNPKADPDHLARLRRIMGPDYASQELDGMFTDAVGYVYSFDRERHMRELPSDDPAYYQHRVVGVDPGYGDPYAAAVWLRDFDGCWWMADELYLPSHAIVDDAFPKLREWGEKWKVSTYYVDKRRPSDWESLRRKGLNALPNLEIYGENDRKTIMPMIRVVQALFRENNIFVAPQCEWFAEEAENYAYPDREDKNAGENPVDFRNHLMDASRYAICSVEKNYIGPMQFHRHPARPDEMVPFGSRSKPRRPGEAIPLPTVVQSLAAQDAAFDDKLKRRY
jgi:hypothetical protein